MLHLLETYSLLRYGYPQQVSTVYGYFTRPGLWLLTLGTFRQAITSENASQPDVLVTARLSTIQSSDIDPAYWMASLP